MDWQFKAGLGLSITILFLQYLVKDMPTWILWPGIAFGILLSLWGISPILHIKVPTGPAFLFMLGFVIIVGSLAWGLGAKQQSPELPPNKQPIEELAEEIIRKLPTETGKNIPPTGNLKQRTVDLSN